MTKNSKTMFASAARTASANSTIFGVPGKVAAFYLDVTAASGTTPTLDIDIKGKDPVSGKWFTLVSFTQATAATTERKALADLPDMEVRAEATIGGGTPSFTFSLGMVYTS